MTDARERREAQSSRSLRRYFDQTNGLWHVQIMQGDCYVSANPKEVLTTILGSCIAACLRDPIEGIGGMNHFLLPEGSGSNSHAGAEFGVNAMELLINELLKLGSRRERLQAKLFGGANVLANLTDIGSRNVAFVEQFLDDEAIPVVSKDMGGTAPRKISFWPVTGQARRLAIVCNKNELLEEELRNSRQQKTVGAQDVELF